MTTLIHTCAIAITVVVALFLIYTETARWETEYKSRPRGEPCHAGGLTIDSRD